MARSASSSAASAAHDRPSWVERRNDRRHGVSAVARVRPSQGRSIPVTLHDLSLTGCRIATDLFREGDAVWIAVPPLAPVTARVRWRNTGEAGLRFDQPLHRSVLAHLVRLHAPVGITAVEQRDLKDWTETKRTR